MGEPFEDIDEVGLRIDAVVFTVLHEGVEDRAALAGLWMPDKQPVLRSQFGRADGLFSTVVVDAGLRVSVTSSTCSGNTKRARRIRGSGLAAAGSSRN